MHSSFAFHGFVPRGFANLRSRPNSKNTSLRPINTQEHQNFSITRRSLRAILYDDQGVERGGWGGEPLPSLQKKSLEILIKHCLSGGVGQLFTDFHFQQGVLELKLNEKRGISLSYISCKWLNVTLRFFCFVYLCLIADSIYNTTDCNAVIVMELLD